MLYRFLKSFSYALSGLGYCLRTQRNMRIHFIAAAVVLSFSYYVNLCVQDLMFVFFAISGVIGAEMFNTSIEVIIDICVQEYHPLAKAAKDVAAGAVLLAALNAVLIGYFVLWPHLLQLLF